MITVNGKEWKTAQIKLLTELLFHEAYVVSRIAVEINGSIVPKAKYDATIINDGDVIEIVSFVGGG